MKRMKRWLSVLTVFAVLAAMAPMALAADAGFADVPGDAWYHAPVQWAVERGITGGTGPDTFSPDAACTRGQVVMFLWRAAGSPEAVGRENRFTDVSDGDYFYKAVLWAVEQGITGGVGDGLFGPDQPCTRGQVATFLWRAQGSPDVTNQINPFSDVSFRDYYCYAVLWAVKNDITGGIGGGLFGPDAVCTRSQIVTFLWKAYQGDEGGEVPDKDHVHQEEPIRLIQNDPDLFLAWQELVDKYYFKTHVEIGVISPDSSIYRSTMKSEMASDNPPALFVVTGAEELEQWEDTCYDLRETALCEELISDAFTLTDGDRVTAAAASVESYGLIVNRSLLHTAGYAVEDIRSLGDLQMIAEDITARSEELGFRAFTSWQDTTLLANLPVYYETVHDGTSGGALVGTYLDSLRSVWELYVNNSTCAPEARGSGTAEDGLREFLNGEAVFHQGGTWDYEAVSQVYGDEALAMIPIYFGVDDAAQGLCTGSEIYWCVNANAEPEKLEGMLAFLDWVVTDTTAANILYKKMGYEIPYENAKQSENLFARQGRAAAQSGKYPITYCFERMPDEEWKTDLNTALTAYAQAQTEENWQKVTEAYLAN